MHVCDAAKVYEELKLLLFLHHRKRLLVAVKWQFSVDNTAPDRCLNRKFRDWSYETDQNEVEFWIVSMKINLSLPRGWFWQANLWFHAVRAALICWPPKSKCHPQIHRSQLIGIFRSKYLNYIIDKNHRFIKRVTRPVVGFTRSIPQLQRYLGQKPHTWYE